MNPLRIIQFLSIILTVSAEKEGNAFFLFVGTYTENTPEVKNATGEGIYVYRVNPEASDGSLHHNFVATIPDLYSPSFLDITNDRKFLYATSEADNLNQSLIHGYAISSNDQENFQYRHIGSWEVGGVIIAHMKIDERDNFIFISMYICGCVAAFKIDQTTGQLEKRNFLKFNESSHVHPRQDHPHSHSSILDPKFRYVYFADLGNDCIYRMNYSNEKGFEESTLVKYNAPPGSGPRHMVLHRVNHKFLYVTCELNNHLVVYEVEEDGHLVQPWLQDVPVTYGQTQYTSGAAGIDISPDGRFLYVSTRFVDVVTVFKIADSGTVSFLQQIDSGGKVPRNLILSPSSNYLFVANQDTNNVVVYDVDNEYGNLTQKFTWPVNTPQCLKAVQVAGGSAGWMATATTPLIISLMQILNWIRF